MVSMDKDVLIAVVTAMGAVIVASIGGWFTYLAARSKAVRAEKVKLYEVERELQFKRDALGLSEFVGEYESIREEVLALIRETCIDRWILFRAWNGKHDPRWTTSIYQIRASDQCVVPYISYEMDLDYRQRMIEMLNTKGVFMDVDTLPECDVKRIYKSEGVKKSYWGHVVNLMLKGSTSRAIVYCSYATHSDEPITPAVQLRCDLLSSRLRGLAIHMHSDIGDLDESS